MKGDRRHELQRNDLADWLAKTAEQVRPYSRVLTLGVLVCVLAALVYIYVSRRSTAQASLASNDLYRGLSARSAADLEGIAAQFPSHNVGHLSAVLAGDMHLSRGCMELFENKATASDELRKAVEQYRAVQDGCREPALLEQATFGLGRAYEALAGTRQSQGELDKAIQTYEEQLAAWPDGPYAASATRRLADLKRDETKAFYDKFAAFDPKPAVTEQPGPLDAPPSFDLDSIDEDSFPQLLLDAEGADESMPGEGEAEADALPEGPPEETAPAESEEASPPGPELPGASSEKEPSGEEAAKVDEPADNEAGEEPAQGAP